VDVVSGGVIDHYDAEVLSAQDYYPFGMLQPDRKWSLGSYRYGFNGKENDNEVKGEGNQQDYGMRVYDPRIGKFLSVDPITAKYPELTPYQFASNRPIDGIDLDGLEYLRYKLNINGATGQIISSEVIWHNPKQHNEFGPLGKGVLYDITITTWSAWFKVYRSENIQKMVHRNATLLGLKSEYGNYLGKTSLFKVNREGKFSDIYDYTLDAVDAVDNLAKLHDQGYDRVNAVGETGLKLDWGTTPYDEAAMNGWQDILDNYKVGDKDPFNGQQITSGEYSLAWNGNRSFRYIVSDKKESIVKFMKTYYSKEAKHYRGSGWGVSMEKALQADEYNYQLFLRKYMTKDANGNWIRQGKMWHIENENWTPNEPK
jgi:RHS repeat-associated protein